MDAVTNPVTHAFLDAADALEMDARIAAAEYPNELPQEVLDTATEDEPDWFVVTNDYCDKVNRPVWERVFTVVFPPSSAVNEPHAIRALETARSLHEFAMSELDNYDAETDGTKLVRWLRTIADLLVAAANIECVAGW